MTDDRDIIQEKINDGTIFTQVWRDLMSGVTIGVICDTCPPAKSHESPKCFAVSTELYVKACAATLAVKDYDLIFCRCPSCNNDKKLTKVIDGHWNYVGRNIAYDLGIGDIYDDELFEAKFVIKKWLRDTSSVLGVPPITWQKFEALGNSNKPVDYKAWWERVVLFAEEAGLIAKRPQETL